ncbi:MAG TPA: restriction endonuclease subunit S [Bacteroidales bacterium]|nr:restriction endonuclease subunit S [Bacteroidales bacterium]
MKNWVVKKLGEVYDVRDGTHDSPRYVNEGYALITSKNLKNDSLNYDNVNYITEQDYININKRSKVDVGDVLFAMIGTIGNPIVIKDEPDFAIKNVALLKVPENQNSYFLKYYLDSSLVIDKMSRDAKGATQKFVGLGYLRNFEIPLPPLPEQQRIVSILDAAFALISRASINAERCLSLSKALFESYLQLALSPVEGGVFGGSTGSPTKRDGWEEKTIGEIGSPKMCKRIFKEQTTAVGEIPFYKIGTFEKEPDAYISKEIYDEFRAKYSFPKKGDVLISASGTIGRRVRYDGEPAYFQDSNIVWIENDEKQVSNDFLYEFYGTCNWGSTKGATISRLYNDNLKSIKISFPKSKEAQQIIVRQLNALRAETQKLEAIYQQKLLNLEELKKSILQKAFRGELN